jgi:hypothetical protein
LTKKFESIKLESHTCQRKTRWACRDLCLSNRAMQCVLWLRWSTAYCCCRTIHRPSFILQKGEIYANVLWWANNKKVSWLACFDVCCSHFPLAMLSVTILLYTYNIFFDANYLLSRISLTDCLSFSRYNREPIRAYFLGSMLPQICKAAGTETIYTNHCLWSITVQKSSNAG